METIFMLAFIAVLLIVIFAIRHLQRENALLKRQLEKIIEETKNK